MSLLAYHSPTLGLDVEVLFDEEEQIAESIEVSGPTGKLVNIAEHLTPTTITCIEHEVMQQIERSTWPSYMLKVKRGGSLVEDTIVKARSSIDAAQDAEERHGLGCRIEVKSVPWMLTRQAT